MEKRSPHDNGSVPEGEVHSRELNHAIAKPSNEFGKHPYLFDLGKRRLALGTWSSL
jgi:hypothetical protein